MRNFAATFVRAIVVSAVVLAACFAQPVFAAKPAAVQPTIEAVVTLPPGTIGTKTFMVQDRNGKPFAVRAYGVTALPKLTAGDVVHITGRVRGEARGVALIGTVGQNVIRVSGGTVQRAVRQADELTDADAGLAMELHGLLVHQSKRAITLSGEHGKREVEVLPPKNTKLEKHPHESIVVAKGVLAAGANGLQLIVTDEADIQVSAPKPVADPAPAEDDAIVTPAPHSRSKIVAFWVACGLIAAYAAAAAYLHFRNKNGDEAAILTENR
jgi:hypothetical protein